MGYYPEDVSVASGLAKYNSNSRMCDLHQRGRIPEVSTFRDFIWQAGRPHVSSRSFFFPKGGAYIMSLLTAYFLLLDFKQDLSMHGLCWKNSARIQFWVRLRILCPQGCAQRMGHANARRSWLRPACCSRIQSITGYEHGGSLGQNKLPSTQESSNGMVGMGSGHHSYDRSYSGSSTTTTYPDLQAGACMFWNLFRHFWGKSHSGPAILVNCPLSHSVYEWNLTLVWPSQICEHVAEIGPRF